MQILQSSRPQPAPDAKRTLDILRSVKYFFTLWNRASVIAQYERPFHFALPLNLRAPIGHEKFTGKVLV